MSESTEQDVDNLHDALKSVRDVAFLRSQIIQDLERKIAAIEAERELWKTRAFEAERKQDAVTQDLFAARAHVESLKRSVLEESKKVETYSDREDALRVQLKGCQADLESTIAERCRLADELREMTAKYDATARERDELLARLDVPAPEAKVIYVTTEGAKAHEKTLGATTDPWADIKRECDELRVQLKGCAADLESTIAERNRIRTDLEMMVGRMLEVQS